MIGVFRDNWRHIIRLEAFERTATVAHRATAQQFRPSTKSITSDRLTEVIHAVAPDNPEPNDWLHHSCSKYPRMESQFYAEKALADSSAEAVDKSLAVHIQQVAMDHRSCTKVVEVHTAAEG